jgi:hypothetical protein
MASRPVFRTRSDFATGSETDWPGVARRVVGDADSVVGRSVVALSDGVDVGVVVADDDVLESASPL